MLMKTLKNTCDIGKPDEIEMPSQFRIGDKFRFRYDWRVQTSGIVGFRDTWYQDVAEVEVIDVMYNMLTEPSEVVVFLKTVDPLFINRCKCAVFSAPKDMVLERVVPVVPGMLSSRSA